jgi:hypothetical protein
MELTFASCQLIPPHGEPVAQPAQLSVEIRLFELRKGDRALDTD